MSIISYIHYYILASKQAPKVDKQFLNWHQVKQCAIIMYDYQLAEIADFVASCHNADKIIDVYIIYDGKPEQAPKPAFNHKILSKKDFSVFQIPKDTLVAKLHKTDILINLGNKQQLKSHALSKLIPATCKISSYEDVIFDVSLTNTSNFLKEVFTYLNMIKNK